jgi:hypothetical protein
MGNQFKPAIKALILVHTAMLVGQLLMAGIMYFLVSRTNAPLNPQLDKTLQVIALVLAIGGGYAAFFLFKQKVKPLQISDVSINEKLITYRTACIIKYTLLEAPAIFCFIAFFLTHNLAFLILGGILLLVFAGQKPTVTLITYDMNVSREDLFE